MAKELETKLSVQSQHLPALRQWLATLSEASRPRQTSLENIYFDTPDGALNRERIALRMRKTGQSYIQTLKTKGQFQDGAHQRNEWEWPGSSPELDWSLLASTPVARVASAETLSPMFTTNFERTTIDLVSDTVSGELSQVELVIDEGEIRAAERTLALTEVELELKQGPVDQLLVWAERISKEIPIFLNLISKAEQGYWLAGMHELEPAVPESLSVERVLLLMAACWLTGSGEDALLTVCQRWNAGHHSRAVDWLIGELSAGASLSSLLSDRRLGQMQLSLLADNR